MADAPSPGLRDQIAAAIAPLSVRSAQHIADAVMPVVTAAIEKATERDRAENTRLAEQIEADRDAVAPRVLATAREAWAEGFTARAYAREDQEVPNPYASVPACVSCGDALTDRYRASGVCRNCTGTTDDPRFPTPAPGPGDDEEEVEDFEDCLPTYEMSPGALMVVTGPGDTTPTAHTYLGIEGDPSRCWIGWKFDGTDRGADFTEMCGLPADDPVHVDTAREAADPEWVRALIEDRARLQVELQVARGEGGFIATPAEPADPLTEAKIAEAVAASRANQAFMNRLTERIETDRHLLDRLAAAPPVPPGPEDTAPGMPEVRATPGELIDTTIARALAAANQQGPVLLVHNDTRIDVYPKDTAAAVHARRDLARARTLAGAHDEATALRAALDAARATITARDSEISRLQEEVEQRTRIALDRGTALAAVSVALADALRDAATMNPAVDLAADVRTLATQRDTARAALARVEAHLTADDWYDGPPTFAKAGTLRVITARDLRAALRGGGNSADTGTAASPALTIRKADGRDWRGECTCKQWGFYSDDPANIASDWTHHIEDDPAHNPAPAAGGTPTPAPDGPSPEGQA